MPIETNEGTSDVERWADMRARSAARNRVAFLWGTAFLAVAFGAAAIDMFLVRTLPGRESIFGIPAKDADGLLRLAVPVALCTAIAHFVIRRFWPRSEL